MKSPYAGLGPEHFWRTAVAEPHPEAAANLYRKKFSIAPSDKIATAGSCFAQHVADYMRRGGFSVMDVEPESFPRETARAFGYGMYSARYGNIYTARQLLQLARDADVGAVDANDIWEKDGRYYDALRPNVEPDGLESVEEAISLRRHHLAKVKQLFQTMDVFVFTFGLTEAWVHRASGRVYPTAPGTIAGDYDPDRFVFQNFGFRETYDDFVQFLDLVRGWNPALRVVLTVSPVPLTATASDNHVLVATTYSKSVLRAVAGTLAADDAHIDYFPSYEIIANPWSRGVFYEPNMRSVSAAGVDAVMRVFFGEHGGAAADRDGDEDAVCEEILLEAFASPTPDETPADRPPKRRHG